MSQEEGINLAGIRRILELERRVEALESERDTLRESVAASEARRNRVFAASADGQVMPMRRGQRPWERPASSSGGPLTVWDPRPASMGSGHSSARSCGLPADRSSLGLPGAQALAPLSRGRSSPGERLDAMPVS